MLQRQFRAASAVDRQIVTLWVDWRLWGYHQRDLRAAARWARCVAARTATAPKDLSFSTDK